MNVLIVVPWDQEYRGVASVVGGIGGGPRSRASVLEYSPEVLDWAGCGAVQGGECTGDPGGFPRGAQAVVGGEFQEDRYFVRTVGDQVTADVIKKYIRFHEAKKRHAEQLKMF